VTRPGASLLASLLGPIAMAAVAASPEVPDLSAGEALLRAAPEPVVRRLLDEGVVVLDEAGEMVRAYVLFDQPMERVFELLAATERQDEFRAELEDLATVERLPDGHVDEYRIRILFVEVDYRVRYHLDRERRTIRWDLDPGYEGRMRRVEGSWELFAMDPNRTLGRLATAVNMGEGLPAALQQALTRRSLPRTLDGCRRWVNSGGAAP
jgi:hypothetical protein